MAFRITIDELVESEEITDDKTVIRRYEQTVDALDLKKIIDAVNAKPRVYTKRAKKGEQS